MLCGRNTHNGLFKELRMLVPMYRLYVYVLDVIPRLKVGLALWCRSTYFLRKHMGILKRFQLVKAWHVEFCGTFKHVLFGYHANKFWFVKSGVHRCTRRFTLGSHRLSHSNRVHLCNEYSGLRVAFWSKSRGHFWVNIAFEFFYLRMDHITNFNFHLL